MHTAHGPRHEGGSGLSESTKDAPGEAAKSPRQRRREQQAAANRAAWAPMQSELAARRVRSLLCIPLLW